MFTNRTLELVKWQADMTDVAHIAFSRLSMLLRAAGVCWRSSSRQAQPLLLLLLLVVVRPGAGQASCSVSA
jgi:hypothetical protein